MGDLLEEVLKILVKIKYRKEDSAWRAAIRKMLFFQNKNCRNVEMWVVLELQ